MHRQLLALLAVISCICLASCVTGVRIPHAEPLELPIKEEPPFQAANPSAFPQNSGMWRKAELVEVLRREFSALSEKRAELKLADQNIIVSREVPYRRINFWYSDLATLNMHGTCSQYIHVWLSVSGAVAGIYVERMSCPI